MMTSEAALAVSPAMINSDRNSSPAWNAWPILSSASLIPCLISPNGSVSASIAVFAAAMAADSSPSRMALESCAISSDDMFSFLLMKPCTI